MSVLLSTPIAAATFVVVDLETTGVIAGRDDIVEIAALVVAGGAEPTVALSTLVQPSGGVRATEIHGITDEDVAQAPRMQELLESIEAVTANRILVAHNAPFEIGFLRRAFQRFDRQLELPHVCTMRIFELLRLGSQYPLRHACGSLGIDIGRQHSALDDALATARLLQSLVRQLHTKGVKTFKDLVALSRKKSDFESLQHGYAPAPKHMLSSSSVRQRPRSIAPSVRVSRLREYQNGVLQALTDMEASEEEIRRVVSLREELCIDLEEMRAVHARVMVAMVLRYSEDKRIDDVERAHLKRLFHALDALGWAPGT